MRFDIDITRCEYIDHALEISVRTNPGLMRSQLMFFLWGLERHYDIILAEINMPYQKRIGKWEISKRFKRRPTARDISRTKADLLRRLKANEKKWILEQRRHRAAEKTQQSLTLPQGFQTSIDFDGHLKIHGNVKIDPLKDLPGIKKVLPQIFAD